MHVVEADPGEGFAHEPLDVADEEDPDTDQAYVSSEYFGGVQPMAQMPFSLLTQMV